MPDRRQLIIGGIGAMALSAWPAGLGRAASDPAGMMRAIPSSGEKIPAVGLGSWITFNVGNDPELASDSASLDGLTIGSKTLTFKNWLTKSHGASFGDDAIQNAIARLDQIPTDLTDLLDTIRAAGGLHHPRVSGRQAT